MCMFLCSKDILKQLAKCGGLFKILNPLLLTDTDKCTNHIQHTVLACTCATSRDRK